MKKSASKAALTGERTEEQIKGLKAANPKGIYAVEVGDHVAYFRNPTRQDINIAASQLDQDNPIDYFENIMRETFIDGSQSVIDEDELYLGALNQVRKKIEGSKAVLVNL